MKKIIISFILTLNLFFLFSCKPESTPVIKEMYFPLSTTTYVENYNINKENVKMYKGNYFEVSYDDFCYNYSLKENGDFYLINNYEKWINVYTTLNACLIDPLPEEDAKKMFEDKVYLLYKRTASSSLEIEVIYKYEKISNKIELEYQSKDKIGDDAISRCFDMVEIPKDYLNKLYPELLIEEYDGVDIAYIEYTTVDYNGGYTECRKLDIINNVLTERCFFNEDDALEKQIISTNDKDNKEFINSIYSLGFFDIEENYINNNVIDGYGWDLIIEFVDGTKKISKGSNASPYELFKKCDIIFYDIFGTELFDLVPTSYKNPQSLNVEITKEISEYHHETTFTGLTICNYIWRNKEVNDVDPFVKAIYNQNYVYENGYKYIFSISNYNIDEKYKNISIYSYDLYASDKYEIISHYTKNELLFELELNRIYIVVAEYDNGKVQYSFSTKTS